VCDERRRVSAARVALLFLAGAATPVGAAGAPHYRPIRRLTVPVDGGGFGTALARVGSQLLVGAPNLGAAESTEAHGYLFDPATGAVVHDLVVPVGHDRWWQFSVGAVGANPFVGISPGAEEDGLDGTVTVFDGATGSVTQTLCCYGGIAAGVGTRVAIGAFHGGGIFDPPTGDLLAGLAIPEPEQQGVLSMLAIGTRTVALAAAHPVGVHLFDVPSGKRIGFVGTRHGDARRFGSAMAANGSTLAVTETPQVNVFDVGFGIYLGTIDPPPGLGGAFGASLAYAGGRLVVGAPSAGDHGAVHVYDANGNLFETLPADDAGAGFGRAVVGLGNSIAVGAPTDGGGAVVIYAPCGDGVVDTPVEQCDDGNTAADDACDDECRMVVAGGAVCGDADGNGITSLSDGVQVLRAAAELSSSCTLARCDVDGNGSIGTTDGVQVLRAAAGLPFVGNCESRAASFTADAR
jgi:cysteine-rich repeat protein